MRRIRIPAHIWRPRRRILRSFPATPHSYRQQVACWLLRLLANSRADVEAVEAKGLLEAIGLGHLKLKNLSQPRALSAFRVRLKELEREPLDRSATLYKNIDRIADLIGLSVLEKETLTFVVLLQISSILKTLLDQVHDLTATSVTDLVAAAIGVKPNLMQLVFRYESTLAASGLVTVSHAESDASDMLNLLEGLQYALLEEAEDGPKLFRQYFSLASPARYPLSAFPHLKDDVAVLQRLLSPSKHETGVNVLIYGPSGIGKTEFVKSLAMATNRPLFEVGHESEDSDLDEQHVRFRSYLLCQKVLHQNARGWILFDEVEDIFPDTLMAGLGRTITSGRFKSWTNTVLESNRRPAFWLCNEIRQIARSFRRRFRYTIEFRTPPRSVRRVMLTQRLENMPVRPQWIDQVSKNPHLTPALIEQTGKIVAALQHEDPATVEALAIRILRRNLDALDLPSDYLTNRKSPPLEYRLDFLNSSHDLTALTKNLKARPKERLCFFGPPGTGKTAYSEYLSDQLEMPLLKKTPSDLLDCYIGETEKNLKAMFREAEEEGAILFLDEADSFLQERAMAQRSWEITQVNELLKQIEQFEGLFICATNLIDRLDSAVFRRCEFKIEFGYLRPHQAQQLFARVLADIDGYKRPRPLAEFVKIRLLRLSTLTPGDFATVIRQGRALGTRYDAGQLLAVLEFECRAKMRGGKQVNGFLAC